MSSTCQNKGCHPGRTQPRSRAWISTLLSSLILGLFLSGEALSSDTSAKKSNLIPVRHNGQTCQMIGNYPVDKLELIHSLSPDLILQVSSLSDVRRSKGKLDQSTDYPSDLQSYLKQVRQYLDRMEAFHRSLQKSLPSKNTEGFLSDLKQYSKAVDWDAKLKSPLEEFFKFPTSVEKLETLTELFSESTGGAPIAPFDRATRQLGIRYRCQFGV